MEEILRTKISLFYHFIILFLGIKRTFLFIFVKFHLLVFLSHICFSNFQQSTFLIRFFKKEKHQFDFNVIKFWWLYKLSPLGNNLSVSNAQNKYWLEELLCCNGIHIWPLVVEILMYIKVCYVAFYISKKKKIFLSHTACIHNCKENLFL